MQEIINVKSNIIDRLLKFIELKSISVNQFHKSIGVGNGYLTKIKSIGSDVIESIGKTYPELNLEWLLIGEGSMIKALEDEGSKVQEPVPNDYKKVSTGIPLIPEAAWAGISSGDINVLELECERFIIPSFRSADFLIPVKGTSMEPKYYSGDIVACKWIPLDSFFQWNRAYVLDTTQGPLIKTLQPAEDTDHLKIVSENTKYSAYNLHKAEIRKLALVLGVIRLE